MRTGARFIRREGAAFGLPFVTLPSSGRGTLTPARVSDPQTRAIAPRPGLPPWAGLLLCTASVRPSVAERANLVLFSCALYARV